ncbi:MAG: energy transducer TonB [Bryobacteraceae bacterium]
MPDQASKSLKIRVRTARAPSRSLDARGYRIRPTSFILSIGFHVVAVAGVLLVPSARPENRVRYKPIYDDLVKPEEKKIVWYSPPKKQLPEVSAQERIGTFPAPRAPVKSPTAIIATAPKPKSAKQFIWQRIPKMEIHEDLPAPNLIARAAMAIPAPAPPLEPKPKVDKPETQGAKAPQPNISAPAPNGNINKAQQINTQPVEIPKPRKSFVPPPPSPRPARAVIPVQTAEIAPPDANITGAPPARAVLPDGIGAPSFSKGAPPPPTAPPGPVNAAGNGKVDIAVVGLHPNDKGNVPDGSRPGQFAQAPTVGEIATGEVKGGFGVPNLTIHDGGKALPPPHVEPPRKVVLYADRLRSLPISTLSVPLHPASRTIPASIEGRFQGRNVYTMVIPIENLPEYSTDWIIWFAERDSPPGAGEALNVRAPVPLRKFESVEPVPPGARTELRVQLAGIITKAGKLEVRALLRNLTPALESAVLQDVESWEFKPATRDGAPVDIDVVLEIPFSLPPQVERSSAP